MALNKIVWPTVGADVSRTPPIHRPSMVSSIRLCELHYRPSWHQGAQRCPPWMKGALLLLTCFHLGRDFQKNVDLPITIRWGEGKRMAMARQEQHCHAESGEASDA